MKEINKLYKTIALVHSLFTGKQEGSGWSKAEPDECKSLRRHCRKRYRDESDRCHRDEDSCESAALAALMDAYSSYDPYDEDGGEELLAAVGVFYGAMCKCEMARKRCSCKVSVMEKRCMELGSVGDCRYKDLWGYGCDSAYECDEKYNEESATSMKEEGGDYCAWSCAIHGGAPGINCSAIALMDGDNNVFRCGLGIISDLEKMIKEVSGSTGRRDIRYSPLRALFENCMRQTMDARGKEACPECLCEQELALAVQKLFKIYKALCTLLNCHESDCPLPLGDGKWWNNYNIEDCFTKEGCGKENNNDTKTPTQNDGGLHDEI